MPSNKPILALMQNMWVKDPAKFYRMTEGNEKLRRRMVEYALFAECLSGKRLRRAFEADLIEKIQWDEASREVSDHASFRPKPDLLHITALIAEFDPEVIICFGEVAAIGVGKVLGITPAYRVLHAPHPASRAGNVMDQLRQVAATLRGRGF